jgi:hypothetical protein
MRLLKRFLILAVLSFGLAGCDQDDKGFDINTTVAKMMPKPHKTILEESVVSPDPDVRRKALYDMAKWQDRQPGLIELVGLTVLGDSDAMVRAQAARTLGAWGDKAGTPYLVKGLTGDMSTFSVKSGASAMVLTKIADSNKFVRIDCARSLGHIPTEDSTKQLVNALRLDPDADVRIASAEALREHRNLAAANGLIVALKDGDLAVAGSARDSLGYLTGRDLGPDPQDWLKFLAETKDPLAGYGHTPKRVTTAIEKVDPNAAKKARIMDIFRDLFPLERKVGPFD